MHKWWWMGVGGCAVLGACASSPGATGWAHAYHPVIMEQGVNGLRYEADRQACEAQARAHASNYEPSNVARFRQCLLNKGYRLLS